MTTPVNVTPVNGYFTTPSAPAANAAAPVPVVVNANQYQGTPTPAMSTDYTALGMNGAILPTTGAAGAATAMKVIPAGTSAAVGAARAIAGNTNAGMLRGVNAIVEGAGEPLLKLSWGLVSGVADFLGAAITFRFGDAFRAIGRIAGEGAVNTGSLFKKLAQPFSLTAATSGGTRLGLGQAIGAGLKGGMTALKSSFIWAIPASAINAFIDYKYKDQTDVKRLATNFGADVIGYTATGMAGAAAGALVGSMTMPIVGTIVGAGVGIVLGLFHDKVTRPLISDTLRDMMA